MSPQLGLADHRLSETIDYFSEQNKYVLASLQATANDPHSVAAFTALAPRVNQVDALSKTPLQQIDLLEDLARRDRLYGSEGASLYDSILAYADRVVSILQVPDTGQLGIFHGPLRVVGNTFRTKLLTTMGLLEDSSALELISKAQWAGRYVDGVSTPIAALQLKTLKNDLLQAEYALLNDWWAVVSPPEKPEVHYAPLIIMDRSRVQPGERIRVTVGVNGYRTLKNMILKVGDTLLEKDSEGVYSHAFLAASPGKREVTVDVKYVNPGGDTNKLYKKLTYYVER